MHKRLMLFAKESLGIKDAVIIDLSKRRTEPYVGYTRKTSKVSILSSWMPSFRGC